MIDIHIRMLFLNVHSFSPLHKPIRNGDIWRIAVNNTVVALYRWSGTIELDASVLTGFVRTLRLAPVQFALAGAPFLDLRRCIISADPFFVHCVVPTTLHQ